MEPAVLSRESAAATERQAVVDKQCVFRIGASYFSLLATAVREVVMTPEVVPVPSCHPALAGMCHARNEFIPVVHLGALLGEPVRGRGAAGKMLVLNGSAGSWALLVEEVIALESLETLVDPDSRQADVNSGAVLGTATFRNQVVRVLDPSRLYQHAEQLLRRGWSQLLKPLDRPTTAVEGAR